MDGTAAAAATRGESGGSVADREESESVSEAVLVLFERDSESGDCVPVGAAEESSVVVVVAVAVVAVDEGCVDAREEDRANEGRGEELSDTETGIPSLTLSETESVSSTAVSTTCVSSPAT